MINKTKGILSLLVLWMCACTSSKIAEQVKIENLKDHIGKKVTLCGKAVNRKLGAVLVVDKGQHIWLDKMNSWPNGYYTEFSSKRIQVMGVLIERYDLPAFIHNPTDSVVQDGIPVSIESNIKEARHRYVLTHYTWNELKEK